MKIRIFLYQSHSKYILSISLQRVLNKEVYTMDLALANEAGLNEKPIYTKLYDAKIDLEINSLFARDFDTVVKKMAVDDEYYENYFRYDKGIIL